MAADRPETDDLDQPARPAGTRYSRFVGLMKILLPLGALGLVAAVIAWPGMDMRPGSLPLSFTDIKADDKGLTMKSPRYVGADRDGQPYTVTADNATQDKLDPERVDLVNPEADMTLKSGRWVNLKADQGLYRPKAQKLDLNGKVEVHTDDGWEAHGTQVVVDLEEGSARSAQPVTGQGPSGTLSADRFSVLERGRRLVFEGNVRMTITPAARS
jgi:lipopolysaccharide export system protein LptC